MKSERLLDIAFIIAFIVGLVVLFTLLSMGI